MIKQISKFLRKYLHFIYKKIEYFVEFILNDNFRQSCMRRKTFGKLNKDKKFYILREERDNWGILTTYTWFIDNMKWAVEQGYIPVVDLKNYYMQMSQDKENAYHENAWDYYFEQPYPEYSLEEVYKSKCVILGWKCAYFPYHRDWVHRLLTKDEMAELHPIVKRYMNFQPMIYQRAKDFLQKHVTGQEKILAVCMRASFKRGEMLKLQLYNEHPKSKTLEDWLSDTAHYMAEWNCGYVFVSVEDREWSETFKQRFGEKCLTLERALMHLFRNGQPVPLDEVDFALQEYKDVSMRKKTEDYLTEVCIVSMCDSLLAQKGSVQTVASLHNGGKYEHTEIYFELV